MADIVKCPRDVQAEEGVYPLLSPGRVDLLGQYMERMLCRCAPASSEVVAGDQGVLCRKVEQPSGYNRFERLAHRAEKCDGTVVLRERIIRLSRFS